MPVERSAGIILFKKTAEGRQYLLLRSSRKDENKPEFWDFPKGVLEAKEKGLEAAIREAKEEAGVTDIEIIPEFKETAQYFTRREGKSIPKFVAMFLGETKKEKIELSWEHDKYEWLPFEEAHKKVSVPQMKEALKKAEEFLISL